MLTTCTFEKDKAMTIGTTEAGDSVKLNIRSVIAILAVTFGIGGTTSLTLYKQGQMADDLKTLTKSIEIMTAKADATAQMVTAQKTELNYKTRDRWRKSDDKAYMGEFCRVNKLEPIDHQCVVEREPRRHD